MPATLTPFVASLRGVIRGAQRLVQDLGLRPTVVTVRTRTWSGADVRLGPYTDSDLVITPTPKVSTQADGSVLVGPIVPAYPGGGYTAEQLNPLAYRGNDQEPVEVLYVLDGPNGTYNYTLTAIESRRPFRYMLRLQSLNRSGPT